MKLITEDIKVQLLANCRDERKDHLPVVKLFDPCGAATWLITEMKPDDPEILFGLCDLGFGFAELRYVSLKELEAATGPAGLGIERDLHFEAQAPLLVYAEAARQARAITEAADLLRQAAATLEAEKRRRRGGP